MKATLLAACSSLCLGIFPFGPARAQTYPAKPIRLVIPAPAAGGADVIARPIAQRLTESLGQAVIVDNRPAMGGVAAASNVVLAPPDGYTLLFGTSSSLAITPFLYRKRPYDPAQDFSPITLAATSPLMVTVHPALPVKSLKDLIALARSRPRQLLYASNGNGSLSHVTTELFSRAAGVSLVHVPYKGGTPAVIDTMSGQVQMVITALPTLIAQVRSSRLRALAVTSSARSTAVPELPTVAESGMPGFEVVQWFAFFAPRNTQAAIIDRLFAEIRSALDNPAIKAALAREGAEISAEGPQALGRFHQAELAKWEKVVRESKIVLE